MQATVAVVRYASLGADRLGVCSTFLAERLAQGQHLPVYIHKNPDFRWGSSWAQAGVCSAGRRLRVLGRDGGFLGGLCAQRGPLLPP